jgi:mRNA degradation ribonuclease J1/J2
MVGDRVRMGREGVVLATLGPGREQGRWTVRVSLRGVVPAAEQAHAEGEAEAAVRRHLAERPQDAEDPDQAEHTVAQALRRHFRRLAGRRPLVQVASLG